MMQHKEWHTLGGPFMLLLLIKKLLEFLLHNCTS